MGSGGHPGWTGPQKTPMSSSLWLSWKSGGGSLDALMCKRASADPGRLLSGFADPGRLLSGFADIRSSGDMD